MKRYIIIGNSAAGISAAEAIRKKDKESRIAMISDEDYPSYCRCLISYYLAGDIKEKEILYRADSFYKENNIELILNKKITRVEPKKNAVYFEDKTKHEFDSLLIATGSSPKMPEIKGIDKKGVYGFRTIRDAKELNTLVAASKPACISGGGLVGLKAAYALKKRGLKVKVIVKSGQVLSQVLDREAAQLVQNKLESNGVELIFGHDVAEVVGEDNIKALKLDSGKTIEASILIVSKGVAPNIDMVSGTDIKVNEGIIADNTLRTAVPNIYAAGDVCEAYDITLKAGCVNALWPIAVWQGRVAGANMAGEKVKYEGSLGMNSLEFFGLPTMSFGIFKVKDGQGFEEIKLKNAKAGTYKKFVIKNNRLVGVVLAGKVANGGIFLRLIKDGIDIVPFRDRLTEESFGYPDIIEHIKGKDKENMYV
ncbi:MAG: FAD-dependent oxidoreductase [Candidatus Omnitrophota bacterium]|nr:FAD-dependent oxidoreductase [Candidatus Omnitrophota bacterium]